MSWSRQIHIKSPSELDIMREAGRHIGGSPRPDALRSDEQPPAGPGAQRRPRRAVFSKAWASMYF